jgi:hypothetical protein
VKIVQRKGVKTYLYPPVLRGEHSPGTYFSEMLMVVDWEVGGLDFSLLVPNAAKLIQFLWSVMSLWQQSLHFRIGNQQYEYSS